MRVTVQIDGVERFASVPHPGADHVLLAAVGTCPACGVKAGWAGLVVAGNGRRVESRDTYAADAVARCCGLRVGTMRVQVDTVFGIEEDERVLAGPWRVY